MSKNCFVLLSIDFTLVPSEFLLKDLKNIPLLLIPYLTICGVLYHIAYWDTFNLNGLFYISASDIIKSATQPVGKVFVLSVLYTLFFDFILHLDKIYPPGGGRETKVGKAINSDIGIFIHLLFWSAIVVGLYFGKDPYRWIAWAMITATPISLYLFNKSTLLNEIPDRKFRSLAIQFLVYLPLFSFGTGKQNGELIFKNIEYKYVKTPSINVKNLIATDTLKFIGATSQNNFFSDLDNTTVIIIGKSDTLILKEKKYQEEKKKNLQPPVRVKTLNSATKDSGR